MFGRGRHVAWLLGELPLLVKRGLLTSETAGALAAHYASEADPASGIGLGRAIFVIAGAVLMALGLILIVGHNWDDLSRSQRAALSFCPLVLGQLWAGGVLWRRVGTAWREASGGFLTLMIGATLALVSQTYHIQGQLDDFLFTWILMALALPYLLGVDAPAVIALLLLDVWLFASGAGERTQWFWWLLAAALSPRLAMARRSSPYGARASILAWVLCASVALAIFPLVERHVGSRFVVLATAYAGLFGVMYGLGRRFFREAPTAWQGAPTALGGKGLMVVAFILSLDQGRFTGWAVGTNTWLLAVPAALATLLAVAAFRGGDRVWGALAGLAPALAVVGLYVAPLAGFSRYYVVVFSAVTLAASLAFIWSGVAERRLGRLNGGLLLLAALAVARFVMTDMGMVTRGLAFIVVGVAFLGLNLTVLRARRRS